MARHVTGSALALAHGAFNAVTGLWPIVHMRSFEAVTGKKVDRWLVRTVGGLLFTVGAIQIRERDEGRVPAELGAGTAATLAAIDLYYAARRRISAVYLLDAVGQLGWLIGWLRRRADERSADEQRADLP